MYSFVEAQAAYSSQCKSNCSGKKELKKEEARGLKALAFLLLLFIVALIVYARRR
jgi:hypothetical protein